MRRLRIVPDVELGGRRDVAALLERAAHQHEPLQQARQCGLAHQRHRDIGERPGGDKDQLPRMRPRGGDDRVDRVARVRERGGLGQHGMAEAGFAMHRARPLDCADQGTVAARPDRNVGATGERQHGSRVARRPRQIDIARHSGDAKEFRASGAAQT